MQQQLRSSGIRYRLGAARPNAFCTLLLNPEIDFLSCDHLLVFLAESIADRYLQRVLIRSKLAPDGECPAGQDSTWWRAAWKSLHRHWWTADYRSPAF